MKSFYVADGNKWTKIEKECKHEENETINIPGTDETIVICHKCGKEL